jgi:arylsulfatase
MPQPNVLLLFTDQQRADAVGVDGNPIIKTPHLDRIAREGVLFSSAYTASPVCVSARCSLIYGQYCHNTGCYDNGYNMPTDRPSLMQILTEAGYRTHGIGKMHFCPDRDGLRGFQTRLRQEELRTRVEDDDYLRFLHASGFEHVYDPYGQRGEMYYIPQPAQMPARLHGTQWVGDRAVEFIRDAKKDRPFFLWVSFIHPHPPFTPPTPWNKLYRAALMPLPKVPQQSEQWHTWWNRLQNRYKYRDNGIDNNLLRCMKAYYWACVSFIDFQVGRILAALEEGAMLDDTLIIHTSDHGEMLGDYDCFGKRTMLDPAARIPMLARFPARLKAGVRCDSPVSIVDVMPTILAAAGLRAPEGQCDGVDLAEVASGSHADRTVYSQLGERARGLYMACNRRWKYIYSSADRREYLIDRITDAAETRNRAGVSLCDAALKEMRSGLIGCLRSEGYEEPLDGDTWKHYPQPEISPNPDAGLLIQDAAWSQPHQRIPGYTD